MTYPIPGHTYIIKGAVLNGQYKVVSLHAGGDHHTFKVYGDQRGYYMNQHEFKEI